MKTLSEMQALCDAATEGPWEIEENTIVHNENGEVYKAYSSINSSVWKEFAAVVTGHASCPEEGQANAAFIAASREFVPWVIARIRELEKQLEENQK